MHAGHADPQRVRARESAEPHQRGVDGDLGDLGQVPQCVGGVAGDDPAAGVDDRPLGVGDRLRGGGDLARVAAGGRRHVPGDHRRVRAAVGLDVLAPDVHADIDEHGAGSAGLGDVDGLGQGLRQVDGVLDQVGVLDDRQRDADDVGLLEGVGPDAASIRPGR